MTIRKKLILLYSGMLGIVIIVFGLVIFSVIRSTWIESVDNSLWNTADLVIKNSGSYSVREFGTPYNIQVVLPMQLDVFRASNVLVQVWLFSSEGNLTLSGTSDNITKYRQPLDPDAFETSDVRYTSVKINNTEVRVLTRAIRVIGNQIAGYIQTAATLQTVNEATNRLSLFVLLGGGLAVLMSVILGTWLSDQSLKPIEAITQAAANISTAQDLATRLPWSGPVDELGRLTSVFNHMIDRLEHLFTVQQRFVADVSHELRTPLTAIRGNLDLIKRYGMDAESLEAIESETDRMSRMVNDLLLLARADYGGLSLDMAEIDLDTVLTDVFREAKVLAKDRPIQIKLTHLDPIRIQGNPDRLKQLLLNLISNAIKFTPDGGQVTLSLRQESSFARLQVSDTGIGIQPDDLERIFDRFFQVDASRARPPTREGTGAGLGLSIAKWIVDAHGGKIEAESTPGKGTTFIVRLPIEPENQLDEPSEHDLSYSALALQKLGLSRKKRSPMEPVSHDNERRVTE